MTTSQVYINHKEICLDSANDFNFMKNVLYNIIHSSGVKLKQQGISNLK